MPAALHALADSRPARILVFVALLWAACVPGLFRLEIDVDGRALLPADAPALDVDARVRERFDLRDSVAIVVAAPGPSGIYRADVLALVEALSTSAGSLTGVRPEDVSSLATEGSDRVRTGTLDFRPWLDPLPRTAAELRALRADLEEVDAYSGTLLARDEPASATAILVGVPPDAARGAFVRELRARVDALRPAGADAPELLVVGAPVVEATLGEHVLSDLARLVPLSLLVTALVFWLVFRSVWAVLLPLLEVGVALTIVFGVLGYVGVALTLPMAVLPVVLTAVGVADELHLFTAFLRRVRCGAPSRDAARGTLAELAGPITFTSLTTAIGFVAFAASPIAPVRHFGLALAGGALVCLAFSLWALPACLMAVPDEHWRTTAARGGLVLRLEAALQRLGALARARAPLVWAATLGLAVVAGFVARGIDVQDSWLRGFARDSDVRRDTLRTEELFGGAHLLQVAVTSTATDLTGDIAPGAAEPFALTVTPALDVEAGALVGMRLTLQQRKNDGEFAAMHALEWRVAGARTEEGATRLELAADGRSLASRISSGRETRWRLSDSGRVLQPEVLAHVTALEQRLAQAAPLGVRRVQGPGEHLATMNFMLGSRDPARRLVPEDRARLTQVVRHYENVRGSARLARLLAPDGTGCVVTAFLADPDFQRTRQLFDDLEDFAREELAPHGLALALAGDLAVSQSLVGGVVRTQLSSLALALLGVLICTLVLLRSLRAALACVLPALLGVLASFGLMGATGMPLGVATSMFAGITLGIGVDYALHLAARHRAFVAAGAADPAGAALRAVGPALLIDAAALTAGFGLLMLSSVPANARLGALLVTTLITCVAASLALVPLCLGGQPTSRA